MRKSRPLCLDASIVIQVIMYPDAPIQEQWHAQIEQGAALIAPALLFYEVVNGLYQYKKHAQISDAMLLDTIATALALPIEIVESDEIHKQAAALASDLSLPATYDAHYLALAQRLGAEFWTADRRLAEKAREYGILTTQLPN